MVAPAVVVQLQHLFATYHSGTGGHNLVFRTAVPSANQLKAGDILFAPINALSLAGGTIKDGYNNNQYNYH